MLLLRIADTEIGDQPPVGRRCQGGGHLGNLSDNPMGGVTATDVHGNMAMSTTDHAFGGQSLTDGSGANIGFSQPTMTGADIVGADGSFGGSIEGRGLRREGRNRPVPTSVSTTAE